MNSKRKKIVGICALLTLLAGCGNASSQVETEDNTVSENTTETVATTEENKKIEKPEDKEWTLSENVVVTLSGFAQLEEYDENTATIIMVQGDQVEITGEGATCEGRRILVRDEGTYVISGESENARIVVEAPEKKVQLVLNNVKLTSEDGAVIYGKEAKKISITCPAGTENVLADGVQHMDEKEKAAIYATCDLYLNGTGSLKVCGNYKNGIATKDDLKVYHTVLDVEAINHGLKGNDSILIVDASVTVYGGADGLQVEEEENTQKGNLVVMDSYLYVTAEDDCLQIPTAIILKDAEVICRAYDKIVNCDGYTEGTDDIMVWR